MLSVFIGAASLSGLIVTGGPTFAAEDPASSGLAWFCKGSALRTVAELPQADREDEAAAASAPARPAEDEWSRAYTDCLPIKLTPPGPEGAVGMSSIDDEEEETCDEDARCAPVAPMPPRSAGPIYLFDGLLAPVRLPRPLPVAGRRAPRRLGSRAAGHPRDLFEPPRLG